MNCPRCGLDQPEASECINCGVVFAKVDRPPSPRPVTTSPGEAPERSRSSLVGVLLLAALAIALGLLLLPRTPPPAPAPEPEPELEASEPAEPRPVRVAAPRDEAPEPAEAETETAALTADGQVVFEAPKRERRPVRLLTAWYEDHTGYQKAMAEAREDGTPVAVYFYTDWCGYCQQLDEEILSTPHVQDQLRYLVKVKINPEHGPQEQAIAEEYGIEGYPSFFVLDSADGEPKPINRGVQTMDGQRLKTPREFVDTCFKAARI